MPRATVSTEAVRKDLKSCPGGYVMLKQLSFGDMLKRRDRAARYTSLQANGAQGNIQIDILNEFSRLHDFPRCVIDHNLEDEEGKKLDFSEHMIKMTLEVLDPRIGSEIEGYIDEMNQENIETADFTVQSESPSMPTSEE